MTSIGIVLAALDGGACKITVTGTIGIEDLPPRPASGERRLWAQALMSAGQGTVGGRLTPAQVAELHALAALPPGHASLLTVELDRGRYARPRLLLAYIDDHSQYVSIGIRTDRRWVTAWAPAGDILAALTPAARPAV